jgi:hypothetical protein
MLSLEVHNPREQSMKCFLTIGKPKVIDRHAKKLESRSHSLVRGTKSVGMARQNRFS